MRTRLRTELTRLRLRRAAVRLASHGWDVLPGAYLSDDRFRCGPGCRTVSCHPAGSCHPTWRRWEESASRDPAVVARWWSSRPHAVLLPTGRAFDVLEVPAALGERVAGARPPGPLAATDTGRWMLLVRPGGPLRPELAERDEVVLHGWGSWVPAPPSPGLSGCTRWLVSPTEVGWTLPDPNPVQAGLAGALPAARARRLPGAGRVQPA